MNIFKTSLLYGFLITAITVSAMTENNEQQWQNESRCNSDQNVIYITNAVPVDDLTTYTNATFISIQDNNIISNPSMRTEELVVYFTVASLIEQQENRNNFSVIHNENYVNYSSYCCCTIPRAYNNSYMKCCFGPIMCCDTLPKCCVVSEKHRYPDRLSCCPPSATATLCGCIKCDVLYADNTRDFICYNATCSCCMLAAIPFTPFCCCYRALRKK